MTANPRVALALLVAAQLGFGCGVVQTPEQTSGSSTSAKDTLLGTVSEVGSVPATWISLRPSDGSRSVTLLGPVAAPLSGLTGAEVWVEGVRSPEGFEVSRFVVRGVNGQPVDDGIVEKKGSEWGVQLASGGWRAVSYPSPQFTALVGQRVWVSRPPPDRAASFGVISRTATAN